jgi:uncharacterized protein
VTTVARISIAPVKGLALAEVDEVALTGEGVAENRRFFLLDASGRFYAGLRNGRIVQIAVAYDDAAGRLRLTFPGGEAVEEEVRLGEAVVTDFYGRDVGGRFVVGPWAEALSRFAGRPLRLVRADRPGGGVDRDRGPVSLVSDASLAELARRAGLDVPVDGRRFRMLFEVTGCGPHEEDEWCGRAVRLGEAVVRVLEPVARCATTTQDPATGVRDFDTLRAITAYRGLRDGEAIDFGVYGEVVQPGRVRVGDVVAPV